MVVLPWIYKRIVSAFLAVMLFFTGGLWKDVVANPTEKIAEGADIRVVTFNLRYTGSGKTSIAYRAPLMAAQLKEIDADSMGFQEATLRWMIYLEKHLDGYDYVGVSRQDGMQIGEFRFDSVLTISQKSELTAITKVSFVERYAKNIGLVQKQQIDIYSDTYNPDADIEDRITQGTLIYYDLIGFGK